MSRYRLAIGCLFLTAVAALRAQPPKDGDPPKANGDDELKTARMTHMKRAAKGYEIALTADETKKLTLTEEPVLRFDDQVTGVVDGTVFVWMHDDRPTAVASVWIRKTGHEFHEFQSLATAGLTASLDGEVRWKPVKADVERKPLPDAPAPAATAAGRLGQMRAAAREYTASVSPGTKSEMELRLLPQPVCRYGRAAGPVVDGGLFAYCKGTNPEVLILVEAVKKDEGLVWTHTFARMTSRSCVVVRDKKEVWSVPGVSGGGDNSPTDPYFNVVQRYKGPGSDAPPAKDP